MGEVWLLGVSWGESPPESSDSPEGGSRIAVHTAAWTKSAACISQMAEMAWGAGR